MYRIEDLLTGKRHDAHAVRLRFYYCDSHLDLSDTLRDPLAAQQYALFEPSAIVDHRYAKDSKSYELKIRWKGLSVVEDSWESFMEIFSANSDMVTTYIHSLDSRTKGFSALKDLILSDSDDVGDDELSRRYSLMAY